jgi:hypothetical protein
MRLGPEPILWYDLSYRKGNHLKDPSVDGRIILRRIFRKWDGEWIRLIWLRIGTGEGHL